MIRAELAGHPAQVFVLPGTVHCAAQPTLLKTLLGSCVSVCLWDRGRRTGGMNHFVLPFATNGGGNLRYGDAAIGQLLDELFDLRCRTGDLQAKIFGGASVLASNPGTSAGDRNVRYAVERLRRAGIPITAHRTGGTSGMMIDFCTATGEVRVRDMDARPP